MDPKLNYRKTSSDRSMLTNRLHNYRKTGQRYAGEYEK